MNTILTTEEWERQKMESWQAIKAPNPPPPMTYEVWLAEFDRLLGEVGAIWDTERLSEHARRRIG